MKLNITALGAVNWRRLCLAMMISLTWSTGVEAQYTAADAEAVRLAPLGASSNTRINQQGKSDSGPRAESRAITGLPPPAPATSKPGEFELYVQGLPGGAGIRRLGYDLSTGESGSAAGGSDASDFSPVVPPDYLVRAGDELVVTLWGSVEADLRLQVDRSGRITIPRVGPIFVSGVRYADLPDAINRRVALVYKNFQVSVSLGQLRGVRVYVTGFVDRPGAVIVSSLSTLMQALLRAGGPSSAGSFRDIQLRRSDARVVTLDLYDLLLNGNRSADQLVQPEDVIHVGPVGAQVAMIGSVNRPAIFEVKKSETVDDLLRMAGGYSTVADTTRLAIERLDDRSTVRVTQIEQPLAGRLTLSNGDVLRAFNAVESAQPLLRQNARVRIEGEVEKPGEYLLPPASTVSDAVRAAGGATSGAYFYGAELMRESVRETQQRNYERALRDFQTQLIRNSNTRRIDNPDEAAAVATSTAAGNRFIEQLRTLKPTGRIVLPLTPESNALPEMVVETGDRIYVPPKPSTIGVFGSVFSAGSYLHSGNRTVGDYLALAGGPTRGADEESVFVVRANGSVRSSLQSSGYFSRGNQVAGLAVDPGDTIFVPEELNKTSFLQSAKDWTLLLYQLGIGIAGIKSALTN